MAAPPLSTRSGAEGDSAQRVHATALERGYRQAPGRGARLGRSLGFAGRTSTRKPASSIRQQLLCSGEYGPTRTEAGVREIPLSDDLKDALVAHKLASKFSQDGHPIFASRLRDSTSHRNVTRRGWKAVRDEAGLPKSLSFHDRQPRCC